MKTLVENFKTAAKITVLQGILIIVFVSLFIFGLTEYRYKTIYFSLASFAFIAYVFSLWYKPWYFALLNDQDFLVIRFYNPHPFVQNYKQLKVRLKEFDGYEVVRKMGRKFLVIKIRTKKAKGKYEPISINGLSKKQQQELLKILDYVKQYKKVPQDQA